MVKRFGDAPETGIRPKRMSRLRKYLEDAGQNVGLAEHGLYGIDQEPMTSGIEEKKIVAVSTAPEFPQSLIRRALGVAGRLGTEIVGLTVAQPEEADQAGQPGKARELFLQQASRSAGEFALEAKRLGVGFRHVVRFGRPADVVEAECGRLRRVEFVLAAREQRAKDGFQVSMPLFEVTG
ncbi:universal stress protein [Desulfovibrio sp. TomC]|uniref:universal stress protein n=1 Tax=Desulfovibrio sp. TomC TaxID=1562888 RepID=UPI000574F244|nr:universal stress protein [Desulfovibrio sp. TomC]KHK02458.1 hypothetical protein NY78_2216 [Desulfovibrio sp. TomC]